MVVGHKVAQPQAEECLSLRMGRKGVGEWSCVLWGGCRGQWGIKEMQREKRWGVWSRGRGRGRRGRMQWRKGSQSLGLGWEEPCWLSGIYRQRDGGQGCCPTAHPDSSLAE